MSEDLEPVEKVKNPCQTFYLHSSSGEINRYYLKSEADKLIAEKDAEIAQLQAMLEERNKQVGELKEESRWRKFPDEKPKHNGIFIVLIGKRAKTLDAYDTNKGKFQTYRPTAWMPMPKAPEEAK